MNIRPVHTQADLRTFIEFPYLLPFGWLKVLRGIPRLHNYRMFALGVIPEYHGKGIDSLIYRVYVMQI